MKVFDDFFKNSVVGKSATTLSTCFRFQLKDGTVMGFTTLDRDVSFIEEPHVLYRSANISNTALSSTNTLAVDNIDAALLIDHEDINFKQLEQGVYDNAEITTFMFNYELKPYSLTQINKGVKGVVGEVSRSKSRYNTEFRGQKQFLQNKSNTKLSPTCPVLLGDSKCRKDLTNFTFNVEVTEVIDNTTFKINFTAADNYFSYGYVNFTSGENIGIIYDINFNTGNLIRINIPHNYPIVVGDQIKIVAGCDKLANTCRTKFNNIINFRGHEFVQGYKTSSS